MPATPRIVGILGAGKVGTVLARLALAAGHRVLISASGAASRIALIVDVLAPGAEAATTPEVIKAADVVILALPLGKVRTLPAADLVGKLVIDTTNYWEPVDGPLPEFTAPDRGTSEVVASLLPGARIVKAFSHLGYHDLDERGLPADRRGGWGSRWPATTPPTSTTVAALVDELGFEPVVTGPLVGGSPLPGAHPRLRLPPHRRRASARYCTHRKVIGKRHPIGE